LADVTSFLHEINNFVIRLNLYKVLLSITDSYIFRIHRNRKYIFVIYGDVGIEPGNVNVKL